MKRKNLALALASLLCMSAASPAAAQTTRKFTATKDNEYGLVYSLPTTVLDITVEVEHIVKRPGEFYQYSRKYLNESNPITTATDEWKVKKIIVNPRGIPNTKEQYLMTFRSDAGVFIMMSNNNLPLAINTEDYDVPQSQVLPLPVSADPTPLEGPAARQAVSEEMLQSQSTAKRAELAAAKILELRQSRNDFITGQADQMPPDGKALQLVLDQLGAQEAALTAMFMGTEQHSTDVKTYTYTPGTSNDSRHVIARLSVLDGLVSADNLSGDPITLSMQVVERGKMPLNEKGQVREFPKGGVAYMIPGTGHLTVSYQGSTLWDGDFEAAQLGIAFGLDPKMFIDKKAPAYLLLDPVTGGIKELGTK